MSQLHLDEKKEKVFPGLSRSDYVVTSEETTNAALRYNCIAHAVYDQDRWWWPDQLGMIGYVVYWPPGVDMECTLDAFVAAFKSKDFFPCDDLNVDLEPGFEKVVIYLDDNGEPTHAARQLASGTWTSKLGDWEDIEHKTLSCLECKDYGTIGKVLKRRIHQGGGGRE